MADERVRNAVKITDPLTDANEAGVDGSGNLQVIVNAVIATGANTIGAVNLAEHGELDDVAVSVGGALIMAGLVFDDTAPVVVEEGDAGYQRMSLNRNAYGVIRDDAGNERGANVTAANELSVLATAQPGVDIGDVDVLSIIPGVGPTNLGKAEDAAHVTADTGVMLLAVRRDADTVMVDADNDYTPLQTDVNGRLKVETQGGGGGVGATDDALFTTGTDLYTPVGGILDETTPNNLEENDGGIVRMTANRAFHTVLRDGAGAERSADVTASNELAVLASAQPGVDIGDVTILDFGAALTDVDDDIVAFAQTTLRTINLMYGSDGVQWERITTDGLGSMDVNVTLALPAGANTIGGVTTVADEVDDVAVSVGGGVLMAGLVFDDAAPVVVEEGDAGYQRMSINRNAYGVIRDNAGAERGANVTAAFELNVLATAQPGVDIGDVDVLSGPTGASAFEVQGTAADGAAAVGNPVLIAGEEAGGNVQSLHVDASGDLQVDILSGGGETVPIGEVRTENSSTNTAAGSPFDVDGPSEDANTKTVRGFVASASVPIKAELIQVDNDVDTVHLTLFARAGEPLIYNAAHRLYHKVTFGSTAGFDGFTLRLTNLDNTQAADLYGTLFTEDG